MEAAMICENVLDKQQQQPRQRSNKRQLNIPSFLNCKGEREIYVFPDLQDSVTVMKVVLVLYVFLSGVSLRVDRSF